MSPTVTALRVWQLLDVDTSTTRATFFFDHFSFSSTAFYAEILRDYVFVTGNKVPAADFLKYTGSTVGVRFLLQQRLQNANVAAYPTETRCTQPPKRRQSIRTAGPESFSPWFLSLQALSLTPNSFRCQLLPPEKNDPGATIRGNVQ